MTPDQIRQKLANKAVIFQRVFSTPDGAEALAALEEEFARGPMFSTDALQMSYNLGARDLVIYIQQMVRVGGRVNEA